MTTHFTGGKVALIKNLKERMSFGAFMMIIRSDYNYYLNYFFQSNDFRKQIISGKTTTVNQITISMMDNIELLKPDMEKVTKFANFVKQVDKSKVIIEEYIRNLIFI